jgi:hypothetical protein
MRWRKPEYRIGNTPFLSESTAVGSYTYTIVKAVNYFIKGRFIHCPTPH